MMFLISSESRRRLLEPPSKPINMVLDTDAKNEIDDQYAIVYSLLSDSVEVESIHAAPFAKGDYPTPESGMEASYQEILRILDLINPESDVPVFRGSREVLKNTVTPVESEAAKNLISIAMKERDRPLYVVAIGAVTNVISAILMKPEIMGRMVVVWLGAHPTYWDWKMGAEIGSADHYGRAGEFNLNNDPIGAAALFDSGVPLVWIPCKNVAEHLRTVPAEIEHYVKGRGVIGNYLANIFLEWVSGEARSKVLWDISTIAYLINHDWVPTTISRTPKFNPAKLVGKEPTNPFESISAGRHLCRIAVDVKRDQVFLDLFTKIEEYTER